MKARARFVKPAWTISVRRQCELLTVNRGQLYYAPKEERPENLEMMRLMDKHLIDHPTEGVLCSTPQKHRQWLSSIFESLKPLKHEKHPQKIHRQV